MGLLNLNVMYYTAGLRIFHDKFLMSEKGAWYGSANLSSMALNNQQVNLMLWYVQDTDMYNALKVRFEFQVVSCLDLT